MLGRPNMWIHICSKHISSEENYFVQLLLGMHVELKKQIHIFIPKSNSKIKKKIVSDFEVMFPYIYYYYCDHGSGFWC